MSEQADWRYCQKCHATFYDGYSDKGRCPAGSGHTAQGLNFALPHSVANTPTAQGNWRYCQKCHVMFYDGYSDKGRCSAGGGHTAQGLNFTLPHSMASTPTAQGDWRYCQKCHAMFYDGYGDKGRCPAGGGHTAQGLNFTLPHSMPQTPANVGVPPPAPPVGDWSAKFTFDQFWAFTEPLEGGYVADCMFMVQDLQVATGMGITFTGKANRNAGLAMAQALQWVYKLGLPQAGQLCSSEDIARDYDVVLNNKSIDKRPGHLEEWKKITNCRITREGLKRAVRSKIIGNINYVKTKRTGDKYLGDFDTFPADAQLCVASLTWANGNEFNYPKFQKACRAADWFEAAKECGFANKVNTLAQRQAAQELMMHNAGCVARGVGDPKVLYWPTKLTAP